MKILLLALALCFCTTQAQCDLSWSSPVAISTPLTNASDPQIVIDQNGNVTAIWLESGIVMASSLPYGGSWSSPAAISNVSNTSTNPRLGIDSSANVTALWVENTLITSATLPFGSSWGSAVTISGSGAADASLAVNSAGNAVSVWTRSGFIESSTRVSGTWSLVAVISPSGASNPTLAISDFGTAIAAWHNTSGGSDVIVSDTLTISSNTWAATKNVFQGTAAFMHNYPKIAMDSSGNSSIAWFRYNLQNNAYQNVQILASTLTVTGTAWGGTTVISNHGMRNPADLTLKINYDSNSNLFLVWTNSYDGKSFVPESARKLLGGSWSPSIQPQVSSVYSFGIDVALASGTALLTNMVWDDVSSLFIVSQQSNTTNPILHGWTATTTFSSGDENGYPKCALSSTGTTLNAAAVWIHNDGTNNVIAAATGSEAVITPPSDVSASQSSTSLDVYTDYYNTVTWTPSPDLDIAQYNIYRNGVYFATVLSDTYQIVDHNAIQGATVIYGVAAMTSGFRQSAITSYTLFP